MKSFKSFACVIVMICCALVADLRTARADYPTYIAPAPVVPAVVGYSAQRRGIFRQRVVVRPWIAPAVALAPAPVVVQPMVTTYYAPSVRYYAPAVTTYRVGYPIYGF